MCVAGRPPCPTLYNGEHGDVGVTQYIRRSSVVFHRVYLKQVYRRVIMQSQWITLCLCLLAYVLRNLYFREIHSLYVQLLSHSYITNLWADTQVSALFRFIRRTFGDSISPAN